MTTKIETLDLLILLALVAATSALVTSWVVSGGNPRVVEIVGAFILPLSAGAMAIAANLPLRFFYGGTLGDAYLYAATAAAFFLLGEAFYTMNTLVRTFVFSSYLARAFILIAYLFVVIAFSKALRAWRVHEFLPQEKLLAIYGIAVATIAIFAVMGFTIKPLFPSWEYFLYIGFDLCILVLALVFILVFRRSKFGISWILFIAAIIIATIGDLAEISSQLMGGSSGILASTLLWSYAYLIAAYSFIKQKFFIK